MNTRREFLKSIGLGAAYLAFSSCKSFTNGAQKRPNILYIMTDDHTVQAMSCYGSRINKTPNMDRIAKEGIRFDAAFCTNSICAPSRAVLLTGKYSHINGLINNAVVFNGEQQTFPKLLQKAGYETAVVGKWHLKSEPTGFDYWNVLPGQGHYYNPDFKEMGEKKRETGYVTDLITDHSLKWLEERDKQKPFCLLLHHKAPHRAWMPNIKHLNMYDDVKLPVPDTFFDDYDTRCDAARRQAMTISEHMYLAYDLKVPPEQDSEAKSKKEKTGKKYWNNIFKRLNKEQREAWTKVYEPKNIKFREANLSGRELALWKYQRYIKDYLRCIASVDENIGRVLDYLEESGQAKDTIVVYTSDQGFYLGEHGWFDKRFMYEESFGIPLLVRYPWALKAGASNNDMVMNLDFAPTFLDFAGVDIPEDMQGESLRGLLMGETPKNWRKSIYYHYFEFPGAHSVKRHYGVRTSRYKLIHFYYDIDQWELYDLKEDPNELNNLYDDPGYTEIVKQLDEELNRLRKKYNDLDERQYLPKKARVKVKHKAVGCPVRLKKPYSPKYTGGGANALTDGICGDVKTKFDLDYKPYQGFERNDLEAVVDLKKIIPVKKVSTGFLQNMQDWIFLPLTVEYSFSRDGIDFTDSVTIANKIPMKKSDAFRSIFTKKFSGIEARYVSVKAKNAGICPAWHHGAGGGAWIFADEIEIY